MRPEELLALVESAILNRPDTIWKTYHLCWWEDKLQCLHGRHTTEKHPVFWTGHIDSLVDGFSSRQWNELATTLVVFWKEAGL